MSTAQTALPTRTAGTSETCCHFLGLCARKRAAQRMLILFLFSADPGLGLGFLGFVWGCGPRAQLFPLNSDSSAASGRAAQGRGRPGAQPAAPSLQAPSIFPQVLPHLCHAPLCSSRPVLKDNPPCDSPVPTLPHVNRRQRETEAHSPSPGRPSARLLLLAGPRLHLQSPSWLQLPPPLDLGA